MRAQPIEPLTEGPAVRQGLVDVAEPSKGKTTPADAPFEEVLRNLEGVVDRLEGGELSLEESLAAFEEGVRLSRMGAARLDAAEKRVEELLGDGHTTPVFTGEKEPTS